MDDLQVHSLNPEHVHYSVRYPMKTILCSGSPFEIGFQHGQQARAEIQGSIGFYTELFQESSKLSWDEVSQVAEKSLPVLREKLPHNLEEINGIAAGSSLPFLSILALNIRTEITYGLSTDGCTALSLTTTNTANALCPSPNTYLAQNWDWQRAQSANLIHLRILQPPKPSISLITEAGIIGKIGLNSCGVGVCLNAITARGVDWGRVPVHLALRLCLDSRSREEAVGRLKEHGLASACHILVADAAGGTGLECSHRDVVELPMGEEGFVVHTNHFVKPHLGVDDPLQWIDSKPRLARVGELLRDIGRGKGEVEEGIEKVLEDEQGWPTSICREVTEASSVETLFSVVMDLGRKRGRVRMGRPTKVGDEVVLEPCERGSKLDGS